jgi:multidrug efflux system membrane fusion protein
VVTVPVAAIQRGAPGTYVYLVADDNTVAVHPIQLGDQDGDQYAVVSGLSPGDRVVTDGADRLRDGAKVTIPDKTAAPVPGAGGAGGAGDGNPTGRAHDRANWQHRHRPQPGDAQSPGDSQTQGDGQSPGGTKPRRDRPPPSQQSSGGSP